MRSELDRTKAIETAKRWVDSDPLFLDTETTGTGNDDEICDLAFVDMRGEAVYETLVKPSKRIPDVVIAIHHISNEMVVNAPPFDEILDRILEVCAGRIVIAYNMGFDGRLLIQSATARGWLLSPDRDRLKCAMLLYAAYRGNWNANRNSYKWHKLAVAAEQCGIDVPAGLHRARVDADLGRQILLHMASAK
jgi:DNA polymerase III epsilon subunit-like protein